MLKKHDAMMHTLLPLCAGVALLVFAALFLQHKAVNTPVLSEALTQTQSQSSAAWWSSYPNYDGGWPAVHSCNSSSCLGGFKGWCNTKFYTCPLPSYADVYVASDPTQKRVAQVVLPGFFFQFQAYTGPNYSGSISPVLPGTQLTLEWACQDLQSATYSYAGTCNSYDAFNRCIGYNNSGSGTGYQNDYNAAVVDGVVKPPLSGMTVTPQVTTTYNIYCRSAGATTANGIPFPSTPTMSLTVPVVVQPPPNTTIKINGGADGANTTVIEGALVTIAATYAAGSGDTLLASAINGTAINSATSVPCANVTPSNASCWTQPNASKIYTFTPTPGTYYFYAAAKMSKYSVGNYNNYKTVLLTVLAACANGTGAQGSCTSCNNGFASDGAGNCVTQCINGQGPVGACTSCSVGYRLQGFPAGNKTIFLTSGSSWTVPTAWNNMSNSIEVIGGGGGGGFSAVGGGGGGYSKSVNQTLTPNTTVAYAIGAGGAAASSGGDTYFCNSSSNCANITGNAVIAGAKGGSGTGGQVATTGGQASAGFAFGTGALKYSGGGGGATPNDCAASGGGGAAGPNGNGGSTGGVPSCLRGGSGGGGSNGGAGSASVSGNNGTAGGNNFSGSGGGAAGGQFGAAGSNGGGGGGSNGITQGGGGVGGAGTGWTQTSNSTVAGSGGGGGGGGNNPGVFSTGGNGGLYGGGGGGSANNTRGLGAQGIIVIKYNSISSCVATCPTNCNEPGSISPPNCIAKSTYTYDPAINSCNLLSCPTNCNEAGSSYPVCVAKSGFGYNSSTNSCVFGLSSIISFTASPARVRKNVASPATFKYTVTNPPPEGCAISGPAGSMITNPLTVMPQDGVLSSTPTFITVPKSSAFTLTCGSVSAQSTVQLVPAYNEL